MTTEAGAVRQFPLFRIYELWNYSQARIYLEGMKPLVHPAIEDVSVEGILHALSDPVRAAILARIVSSEFPCICSKFLRVNEKTIPRSTLSQHFRALREAGLIRGERRGVEMHNTSRCTELEERFPGLIAAIFNAHHVQAQGKSRAGGATGKRRSRAKQGTGA